MYNDCDAALDAAEREWGEPISGQWGPHGKISGSGTTRAVFRIGGGLVLKVPRYYGGIECNTQEARIAKEGGMFTSSRLPLSPELCAPCELIDYMGIPCLLMEEVEPLPPDGPDLLPEWVDDLCDGRQVGRMKDGRVVCYDFAAEELN